MCVHSAGGVCASWVDASLLGGTSVRAASTDIAVDKIYTEIHRREYDFYARLLGENAESRKNEQILTQHINLLFDVYTTTAAEAHQQRSIHIIAVIINARAALSRFRCASS